jgi:DNA-directed RNA polymerase subunit A"
VEKISTGGVQAELKKDVIVVKPEVETLKNLRKITNKIRKVIVKGVEGITKGIIITKNQKYLIATEGSNLEEVLKLAEVDPYFTTTNDFMEIQRVLGIEAARNSIIEELQKVLQSQDISVDARHLMLIADAMTFIGEIQSVGRHGLAGSKASVLVRAAFEEVEKHLVKASVEGQKDELTGVTENIFVGNVIPVGTGTVDLEMDVE